MESLVLGVHGGDRHGSNGGPCFTVESGPAVEPVVEVEGIV